MIGLRFFTVYISKKNIPRKKLMVSPRTEAQDGTTEEEGHHQRCCHWLLPCTKLLQRVQKSRWQKWQTCHEGNPQDLTYDDINNPKKS